MVRCAPRALLQDWALLHAQIALLASQTWTAIQVLHATSALLGMLALLAKRLALLVRLAQRIRTLTHRQPVRHA